MHRVTRATILAALSFGFSHGIAMAGPCTDDIAKFEATVRKDASNPADGPTTAQSVGAQLSHQPTPESIKQAEQRAQRGFNAVLTRAKELDQAGDSACKQALADAKLMYETK